MKSDWKNGSMRFHVYCLSDFQIKYAQLGKTTLSLLTASAAKFNPGS